MKTIISVKTLLQLKGSGSSRSFVTTKNDSQQFGFEEMILHIEDDDRKQKWFIHLFFFCIIFNTMLNT